MNKKMLFKQGAPLLALLLCAYVLGAGAGKLTAAIPTSVLSAEGSWGLGFPEEGKTPIGNASAEELAKYHAAYCEPTDEKVIYLTFDAGYENGCTEPILNVLKKQKVPAAFFIVGTYLENNPELVKRMVAEGHTVGNHTWHHPDMSKMSDEKSFRAELEPVEKLFEETTGAKMLPYYRPPQGKYSTENLKLAAKLGYHTFFWSLAYVDWYEEKQPTKEEAFDKLLSRIHPGAVVLLHSTSKTNAAILDELLTKWKEMGYHFAPLSELAEKLV